MKFTQALFRRLNNVFTAKLKQPVASIHSGYAAIVLICADASLVSIRTWADFTPLLLPDDFVFSQYAISIVLIPIVMSRIVQRCECLSWWVKSVMEQICDREKIIVSTTCNPSRSLVYRCQNLMYENVKIGDIAQTVGTPAYCYSATTIERNFRSLEQAFTHLSPTICYAVKANSNQAVLRLLASLGAGADIVSGGELRRAIAANIPASKIVFSGVGKTAKEIELALDEGILQFNVESEAELHRINDLASRHNTKASVAFRVNPDVDAKTHTKISTGTHAAKFGIAPSTVRKLYQTAYQLPAITVTGLTMHIGSQITDIVSFQMAYECLHNLAVNLMQIGLPVNRLDLGGGLGIKYRSEEPPTLMDYANLIESLFADLNCEIVLEPGRIIVADAGILISEVVLVKSGEQRTFVVLDAAINDLLRPGLYDAKHRIVPVVKPEPDGPLEQVDLVGPVCESSDTFAQGERLPALHAGDLVAVLDAGAYGAVMASTYNSRLLVPEVLVADSQFDVIRTRGTYETMLAADIVPPWIGR